MSIAGSYGTSARWAKVALVMVALGLPAAARARPVKLLVFGDSLAAGYGLAQPDGFQAQLATALKADGFDVQILDGGVSGDTTAGGRARLDWALADAPDAVLVELGGNDALRALDPAQMQANLTAILDTLAQKHIPTLLSGMYAPPNLGQPYDLAFRAVFDRLSKRPGLRYDPFFLEGVALDPALNQADHIHPNPAGVKKVVARIKPAIEALLREVPQPS
jgi:acyl-CoA thioesterase-1